MTRKIPACACVALLAFGGIADAKELGASCASSAEIAAIQVSAVQQELTDAALACGDKEVQSFNRFQTVFNKELRRSDAFMLSMFKRLDGTIRLQLSGVRDLHPAILRSPLIKRRIADPVLAAQVMNLLHP